MTLLAAAVVASQGAGIARAAEPVSRTLHVSLSGDDAQGMPGDPARPFRSIGRALAVAANGDTVRVAPGQYVVTPGFPVARLNGAGLPEGANDAPLEIVGKSGISLIAEAPGVEIYGEGRGDFLLIENSRNILVEGLIFRGNRPEVPLEEFPYLFPMALLFDYNSNVVFRACQFLQFGNHGISHLFDPKASEAVTVEDCLFADGGALVHGGQLHEDGAAVSGIGSGWVVINNVVRDCVRGFEVEGWAPTAVSNIVIRGNIITNTTNLGVMVFANSGESWRYRNILIADNQIYSTYRTTNEVAVGILITGGENIVVSNNVVRGGSNQGIALNAHMADLVQGSVISNVVEWMVGRGVQMVQFNTFEVRDGRIAGNRVEFSGDSGILVDGRGVVVEGNECARNAAYTARAGIELANASGRAEGMVVRANKLVGDPAFFYQDYGIWVSAGVVGAMVHGNTATPHWLGTILDEGTATDFGAPRRVEPGANQLPAEVIEAHLPATLEETGLFQSLVPLSPAEGLFPYGVLVSSWEQGADFLRWFRAPSGAARFDFSRSTPWSFPVGTCWIQHLSLPQSGGVQRPVETRILVKTIEGIYGLSYRWDDSGTHAVLVGPEGAEAEMQRDGGQGAETIRWRFPGRDDCLRCHNPESGFALGFGTAQLNGEFKYPAASANQLRVLNQAGFLDESLSEVDALPRHAPLRAAERTVGDRIRSYLAANCAACHRAGGAVPSGWDARDSVPLKDAGIVGGALLASPSGDPQARVVVPGSLEHSDLYQRLSLASLGHEGTILRGGVDPELQRWMALWITNDLVHPVVRTDEPEDRNARLTSLHGSVNPNSTRPAMSWFEWGLPPGYAEKTPAWALAPGTTDVAVGAYLYPLQPATLYHYRLCASNSFGISRSAEAFFRTNPNAAPEARADELSTGRDAVLVFTTNDILANDSDPDWLDNLSLISIDSWSRLGGKITWVGREVRYAPPAGFLGIDLFFYSIQDLSGAVSRGRVTVNVVGTNQPPTPGLDFFGTEVGSMLRFDEEQLLLNDVDPDLGDRLRIWGVGDRSAFGGTVLREAGQVVYLPPPGFSGQDRFVYSVVDLAGAVAEADVIVTVAVSYVPLAISPVADVETLEDERMAPILFRVDYDPRVPGLDVEVHSSDEALPSWRLALSGRGHDRTLQVSLPQDFHSRVMITIRCFDGIQAAEESFWLTVLPQPDPPRPGRDELVAESDLPLAIAKAVLLANDTDPDDDGELVVLAVDPQSHEGGSIRIDEDRIIYKAPPGFTGTDGFVYRVADAGGLTAEGEVSVTVKRSVRVSAVGLDTAGRFILGAEGEAGRTYEVQTSGDLIRWVAAGEFVADAQGHFEFQESADPKARFYRVRIP